MRGDAAQVPEADDGDAPGERQLPTAPCSVVWSEGHPFVLEGLGGRWCWAGVDDKGRPRFLSDADLRRRGWTPPTR
ncbi:hypothetical protein CEP50_13460 [Actinopolyspora mortivallis]|uniref:Uncharacterized protein n=1 Tax=Actinopolyspora mortivallis TaxID=33906 RepID=A0A2T0GUY8_ACTMO|nr:hypothetical protein CEP50_13460 [Actinopolyspora mortivallis]